MSDNLCCLVNATQICFACQEQWCDDHHSSIKADEHFIVSKRLRAAYDRSMQQYLYIKLAMNKLLCQR